MLILIDFFQKQSHQLMMVHTFQFKTQRRIFLSKHTLISRSWLLMLVHYLRLRRWYVNFLYFESVIVVKGMYRWLIELESMARQMIEGLVGFWCAWFCLGFLHGRYNAVMILISYQIKLNNIKDKLLTKNMSKMLIVKISNLSSNLSKVSQKAIYLILCFL